MTLKDVSSQVVEAEKDSEGFAIVSEKNEMLVRISQNFTRVLYYAFKNEKGYPLQSLIRPSGVLEGCVALDADGALLNNKGVIVITGRNSCTGGGEKFYVLTPTYP